MTHRSIVLIGGPGSGKSNYIGRLWPALDSGEYALVAAEQPGDISFALDTAEHIFQGRFAPRTEQSDARRDFEITVRNAENGEESKIVLPDISGELWKKAVVESEIDSEWMSELNNATGALLFVGVNSKENIHPLDWINCRKLLSRTGKPQTEGVPTQVMLCELIRFLEIALADPPDGSAPKLSLIVSAWDLVDPETFDNGPEEYVAREWPLLSGRLKDTFLDVKIFGLSIVGGDLDADVEYREKFLEAGLAGHGWVTTLDATDKWHRDSDLTLPVAWVIENQGLL